jgi:putative tryptophan/tyrosine transport system substrate-binding protein
MSGMGRREFVALLGVGAAWPVVARAQQGERMRRIGVLTGVPDADPEAQARFAVFRQALQQLGWHEGRNVRIDYRSGAENTDNFRQSAAEMVGLAPDVIVATAGAIAGALQQVSRTVPIVLVTTIDPVGSGLVDSLARPGRNATGFLAYEYSLSGKWLELLKQIAPNVKRAAVLRDTASPAGNAQFGVIQALAPSLRVEVSPVNMRDTTELERAVATFARSANDALIVTGSPSATAHRYLLITLAARHKLPAVYFARYFVTAGGLMSYGPDFLDQYRRAAGYVDRILKGERPADMPVQAPTKFELVINLKTAKALGLDLPASVLARADEVIE